MLSIPDRLVAADRTRELLAAHMPKRCRPLFLLLGEKLYGYFRYEALLQSLGVRPATLTAQLCVLRTLGFLNTSSAIDDRRFKSYALSTQGRELWTKIEQLWTSL